MLTIDVSTTVGGDASDRTSRESFANMCTFTSRFTASLTYPNSLFHNTK